MSCGNCDACASGGSCEMEAKARATGRASMSPAATALFENDRDVNITFTIPPASTAFVGYPGRNGVAHDYSCARYQITFQQGAGFAAPSASTDRSVTIVNTSGPTARQEGITQRNGGLYLVCNECKTYAEGAGIIGEPQTEVFGKEITNSDPVNPLVGTILVCGRVPLVPGYQPIA